MFTPFQNCAALIVLLMSCLGCGGKSGSTAPVAQPNTVPPPIEQPLQREPKTPPELEPAEPMEPSVIEPPREQPVPVKVDPKLSVLAARLTRKEGTKWQIDEAAQEELESLGPSATIPLITLFADSSVEVRRGVAFYFLDRFDPSNEPLVQAYVDLLNDSDRTIRGLALSAAEKFFPAQRAAAAHELGVVLKSAHDDEQHRATAARLLADVCATSPEVGGQLKTAASNDGSARVRSAALLALGRSPEPARVLGSFQRALRDPDDSVRTVALGRLKALGSAAAPAINDLAPLLESSNARLRSSAAETLVHIGSKSVPTLTAALRSKSRDTRELAVYALGKLGPLAAPALSELKQRLNDDDAKVKELAAAVIAHIESQQP